jgi:hypothetical protein
MFIPDLFHELLPLFKGKIDGEVPFTAGGVDFRLRFQFAVTPYASLA